MSLSKSGSNKPKEHYLNNPNLPAVNSSFEYTPEMIKELKKCKDDILYFAKTYFFIINLDDGRQCIKLHKCQQRVLKKMMENRFFILLASRQIGKALALDTPISTPTGWKTMGELKQGDQVFGSDGQPCNVVHAHDVMHDRVCYKITFDNGETIVADEDHRWFTESKQERPTGGSIKTTKELKETLLYGVEPNHRIPSCISGVEFPEANLPITPYILGIWLGDGASAGGCISVGKRDITELIDIINTSQQQFDKLILHEYTTDNFTLRITSSENVKSRCLSALLSKNNLINNKHIPSVYFQSSRKQRLELLQGLIDSDGYVTKNGICQFYNTNLQLVQEVKQLVESLGYKVTHKTYIPTLNGVECAECGCITFTPIEPVCRLSFKKSRIRLKPPTVQSKYRSQWHYIKSIELVDSVPVRCITVDSPDHLFLAGKQYIPSSNTTLMTIYALWYACFFDDQRVLIVANKEGTAKEILSRIRLAFEELPNWLKPGVKEYGKESVLLSNGSTIGISTTTGTAARGMSINLLIIDELSFIECCSGTSYIFAKRKTTNEITQFTIGEMFNTLPQVQAPDNSVIGITSNNEYEILTPTGWSDFKGVAKYEKRDLFQVITNTGKQLTVSANHAFIDENNEQLKCCECLGKKIQTTNGVEEVVSITQCEPDYVYDCVEVANGSTYYTNDIVSHNTHIVEEFWKSVFPIVSSSKKSKILIASTANGTGNLFYEIYSKAESGENNWAFDKVLWNEIPGRDLKWRREMILAMGSEDDFEQEFGCKFLQTGESVIDEALNNLLKKHIRQPLAILDDGCYKVFKDPDPTGIYLVGVDVAEGVSENFSVIQIFDAQDLTSIEQVAIYACNTIAPMEFTKKLYEILLQWGTPVCAIERNNCGTIVVDQLAYHYNYANLLNFSNQSKGKLLDKAGDRKGILSHTNIKFKGITNKRHWLKEKKCVLIRDEMTLKELKDFVRYPNGSWKARQGTDMYDDRVLAMVWALFALDSDVVDKHFIVEKLDEHRQPLVIKQYNQSGKMDSFIGSGRGGNTPIPFLLPGFEQVNDDMDELKSMGWTSIEPFKW